MILIGVISELFMNLGNGELYITIAVDLTDGIVNNDYTFSDLG